jgi:outer membrane biogenesis lipoprotein LolB
MDGFDDDDEELGDDEEDLEEEVMVMDEDGMLLPLEKMKQWLKNKPRGFGEGKVFDTSIEDKLLEEMEQSAQAQVANVNKLKNDPIQPTSTKAGPIKLGQ